MKAFGVSLIVLFALLVAGCKAGGDAAVVGKWKGAVKMGDNGKKDDPGAKMAEALASMMSMDVELKADHTFSLSMMMMPIEGSWSMSGNRVSLTPKTVAGMSPEDFNKKNSSKGSLQQTSSFDKPLELELQPDGKTMKAVSEKPSTDGTEMIFTKQ